MVEEVGDGNLNDVIRISSPSVKGKNSAVAKRGPPYIKVNIDQLCKYLDFRTVS